MTLQEKIDQDLREAMASKDTGRTGTLRLLKSALKYVAIEKKTGALSDADVVQVIQKQIKQRRESIDQFTKAGRNELAEKEKSEAVVLEAYLPLPMGDAELADIVQSQAALQGAVSKKDFGRMMKVLNEKLSGRADAKRISDCLGKILR